MRKIALVLVAAVLVGLPSPAGAARTRLRRPCSKLYTRDLISVVSLSASIFSPGCGGAALMAEDIFLEASKQFRLPQRYVAHSHGTNRAGDPTAVYPCTISTKFVKTRDGGYGEFTAVCINVKGDNFKYVFDLA